MPAKKKLVDKVDKRLRKKITVGIPMMETPSTNTHLGIQRKSLPRAPKNCARLMWAVRKFNVMPHSANMHNYGLRHTSTEDYLPEPMEIIVRCLRYICYRNLLIVGCRRSRRPTCKSS